MPNVYTASYLLNSMKRRGMIPKTSERSFGREDLLWFMTEECQTYMASLLIGIREEFFDHIYDVTTVSGTDKYAIPPRAVGSKLRQVLLGGNAQSLQVLQRIEPKQQYGSAFGYNSWNTGYLCGYTFFDTSVQLLPPPSGGQLLRMVYFRRPNRIVEESACGTIIAIDTNAQQVTITAGEVPTTFTTAVTYDLVKGSPGFGTLAMDQTITSISGVDVNVLTFTDALPDGLALGDFVCLAGEAPVPQLPVELHPLLAQRVTVKVLEALGDPRLKDAKAMLDEQRAAALVLLTPKDEGTARFLTNFNGPGWNGRYRRW